jgi:hypothetical protein
MDKPHTERYRGHDIEVEVTQHSTGWTWQYVIDKRVQSPPRSRLLPSRDVALRQGIGAAKWRVDEIAGPISP